MKEKNKEFFLKGLLQYNYFPTTRPGKEELPPIFTSEQFTPEVAVSLVKKEREANQKMRGALGYDQLEYRLTRYNSVSRLLSIPHPFPYAELCFKLHENWDKLSYICYNQNSQIKPYPHEDGRLIIMAGYGGLIGNSQRSLGFSFGKRYLVRTDISNCFPSIYSHAIPWALVGHSEAKKNKNKNDWFDEIDKKFRACHRNETQGVAIGPASSNIAAEIVLGRIDDELRKDFCFIRYIDDYECYCDSEHEAKDFVHQLEKLAAKFRLHLNIEKTKISRLPQPVTEDWILELEQHTPISNDPKEKDILRFLDIAVCLSRKHPNSSVLKYAANTINKLKIEYPKNKYCLNYLLGLSFHHSDLLPKLRFLIEGLRLEALGKVINSGEVYEKIIDVLKECIELRRSDGICWALYLLGLVKYEISKNVAINLIDTNDALSILTLYWMGESHRNLVIDYVNNLDKDDLYEMDKHWILLYQLFFDDRIKNPYPGEKCFQVLKENKVSFMLKNDSASLNFEKNNINKEGLVTEGVNQYDLF